MSSTYVNWGESRVKLTWQKQNLLPENHLITSAHGFCFKDGRVLLVDLPHRGWDFPGGHIESQETPEECFKREAFEEGYVEGRCTLLGAIKVDHSENANWTPDSPYPKIGYQVFYKMAITKVWPFESRYESTRRKFIHPDEMPSFYLQWQSVYQTILDCALSRS